MKLKLRMTLDVEYETNGVSEIWLEKRLSKLPDLAVGQGWLLIGDSEAKVEQLNCSVESVRTEPAPIRELVDRYTILDALKGLLNERNRLAEMLASCGYIHVAHGASQTAMRILSLRDRERVESDDANRRNKRLVSILIYEHGHGRDVSAFASYRQAQAYLAGIVRDQWKDRADKDFPDDPSGLRDEKVIYAYFEENDEEFYAIEEIEVDFPD